MDKKQTSGDGGLPKRQHVENSSEDEDDSGEALIGPPNGAVAKRPKHNDEPELDDDESLGSEDSETSDDEMDLNEDSLDDEDMAEVTDLVVDFEGLPPAEEDLGAVEALVGQLFRGIPLNTLHLAKLIVQNDHLSTLLKDRDTDQPSTYGVVSVMNCSQPSVGIHLDLAVRFRDLVLKGIDDHYEREEIEDDIPEVLKSFAIAIDKPTVNVFGLVIIEKMVNIPSPAVWTLLNALREDIEIEGSHYTHFFVMTKFYRAGGEVFPFEEYYESLQEVCSLHIDFPLPKDTDTIPHNGQVGIPFRRLLLIPAPNFYQAVATAGN